MPVLNEFDSIMDLMENYSIESGIHTVKTAAACISLCNKGTVINDITLTHDCQLLENSGSAGSITNGANLDVLLNSGTCKTISNTGRIGTFINARPVNYYGVLPENFHVRIDASGLTGSVEFYDPSGQMRFDIDQDAPPGLYLDIFCGLLPKNLLNVSGKTKGRKWELNFEQDSWNLMINEEFAAVPIEQKVYTLTVQQKDQVITPLVVTGGRHPLKYIVVPILPPGINLCPYTGCVRIIGKDICPQEESSYRFSIDDEPETAVILRIAINAAPVGQASGINQVHDLTVGQQAYSFAPFTVAHGTGAIKFQVTPDLPAGLVLNADTGVVVVNPQAVLPETWFAFSAKDENEVYTCEYSYKITIHGRLTAHANGRAAQVLTISQDNYAFTPLLAYNGSGPLTYKVVPLLPAGILFDKTTGVVNIIGENLTPQTLTTYKFSVKDKNKVYGGDCCVDLTIHPVPVATVNAKSSYALTQGQVEQITIVPLRVDLGSGPITYTVSPSLPTGITLMADSGIVRIDSNMVDVGKAGYTFAAYDKNNVFAKATQTIFLTIHARPEAGAKSKPDRVFTIDQTESTFQPLAGSGGSGRLTYSVKPPLPGSFRLDTETGLVVARPNAVMPQTPFIFSVSDENQVYADESFEMRLVINEKPVAVRNGKTSQILTVNEANYNFTPLKAREGSVPLTFKVYPPLPHGILLNSATGSVSITGNVLRPQKNTRYTFSVSDANNVEAEVTSQVFLTVNLPPLARSNHCLLTRDDCTPTMFFIVGVPVLFTPLTCCDGTVPVTFLVKEGVLPVGLSMNAITGTISGTPKVKEMCEVVFTVCDANKVYGGESRVYLEVHDIPPLQATFLIQELTVNTEDFVFYPLTSLKKGDYIVTPPLPLGMCLDRETGAVQVRGRELTPQLNIQYTFSLNHMDVSTTRLITVNAAPVATGYTDFKTAFTVGQADKTFTPLSALGGTGALTYCVSPRLPPGITLNAKTGLVSVEGKKLVRDVGGVAGVEGVEYTFSVKDANHVKAELDNQVRIRINDAPRFKNHSLAVEVNTPNELVFTVGRTFNFTPITGCEGTAPLTYFIRSGELPKGVTLHPLLGVISGTPTKIQDKRPLVLGLKDDNDVFAEDNHPMNFRVKPCPPACFPGNACVMLENGALCEMKNLQIGQTVFTNAEECSEVYLFTHALEEAEATFVTLRTENDREITLTPSHYLFVNEKLLCASDVGEGDLLETDLGESKVISIVYCREKGLYNPHTLAGDIMVNGIHTSTYTNSLNPELAHVILGPVRYLYSLNKA